MTRKKRTNGKFVIALDGKTASADPRENLERLARAARDSLSFGPELPFEAESWTIRQETANSRAATLWFTARADIAGRVGHDRMAEPFATFLKSIIRLRETVRPGGPQRHLALVDAARYLYLQLERRGYDPSRLETVDFQRAEMAAVREAEEAATRKSQETGKRRRRTLWTPFLVGQNLLRLATVVRDQHLSAASIDYAPRTLPPDYEELRTEQAPDADRLPSRAALDALPRIANEVQDPSDVCMMRTIALLHCAPWRIGELLSLPADCEVLVTPEGQSASFEDLESGKPVRYGLRYKPEKSPDGTPDTKWIPTAAIPLVRRALEDLRKHSAGSREIAAYMEQNPDRAWLPERFREQERLSIDDVAAILDRSRNAAYDWLHANGIPIRRMHVITRELKLSLSSNRHSFKASEKALNESVLSLLAKHAADEIEVDTLKGMVGVGDVHRWLRNKRVEVHEESVSRDDLERRILEINRLTTDFEWKLSECLFLFPKLFFWRERPFRSVVALLNNDQLRFFMTGEKDAEAEGRRKYGIFKRMGFTEPDGTDIHITSHMFRRWLATLALQREMSAEQVRIWLGHEHERGQGPYDVRTPVELAEEARQAIRSGLAKGAVAEIAAAKEPRDRDAFLESVVAAVHITPYGMCVRDWTFSPCARHGACVACEKHAIEKGQPAHRAEIARSLRENQILLDRAMAQAEEGQIGADKHAWHLYREVAVLEATLRVHDDPSIADGTLHQLDVPAVLAEAEREVQE
ncbi:hypothetical protein ABIF63_001256 [Bradyrhizobium japonicum]|uniref:Integrase n=1 Tax=Bradyrhizobium japonicum TaxID=375 RepID=A0ABV2RKS3_BRAJP